MECPYCHEEILQANPTTCPYCGTEIVFSEKESLGLEIEEIGKLEKAGRYEDAAQRYEKLEMWDKAGECRRKARTNYVVSATLDVGKIEAVSIRCPHCGASQPIGLKSNEVACKYCGKSYLVPKNILDLL